MRIYHHYEKWEETKAGLWRRPCGEERRMWIEQCAVFMANTAQFRDAMRRAIVEWPISCEVNFTTKAINRQAWLGHAACCIAIGCPEEPTRAAWWTLTQKQRDDADAAAAEVIEEWERMRYQSNKPKVAWDIDKMQWRVFLPSGGSRLFNRRRWSEAVEFAVSWMSKNRKAA